MAFRLTINVTALAEHLNTTIDRVRERARQEVENLSISTHAFIVAKAQQELPPFLRDKFLGKDNKNVRWVKVSDSIWVVEIDESVAYISEGRPKVFMSWLLNNNPKAKTAKDGSRYAHIPMTQARHTQGGRDKFNNPKAAYEAIVRKTMQDNGLNLKKIEKNPDGSPKIGILHRLNVMEPGDQSQFPGMYSKPRTEEMARQIGLPAHSGIFHLKGLAIIQRTNERGKVVREAVTFRTISSKHEAEGRWMAPEVPAFKFEESARAYAEAQWSQILKSIEEEFTRQA